MARPSVVSYRDTILQERKTHGVIQSSKRHQRKGYHGGETGTEQRLSWSKMTLKERGKQNIRTQLRLFIDALGIE